MIQGIAIREIRFRNGHRIEKGEVLSIHWPDPRSEPGRVEVLHHERMIPGRAATSLGWIGSTISEDALVMAFMDGACETPGGHTVEPDGIDPEGTPSWLRIHGLM